MTLTSRIYLTNLVGVEIIIRFWHLPWPGVPNLIIMLLSTHDHILVPFILSLTLTFKEGHFVLFGERLIFCRSQLEGLRLSDYLILMKPY